MYKKIILSTILLLLAASFVTAADVRAPSASIRSIGQATAQGQANILIIARDLGMGNEGLSKVEVMNQETKEIIFSKNLNGEAVYAETIQITQDTIGTSTYILKVWDLAGNKAEDTTTITFVNNKPTVRITYPNGNEILARTININYTATDLDNDNIKINIYYTTDQGRNWKTIATNQDNTGTYEWNTTNLIDGEYYLRIVAKDSLGERSDLTDNSFTLSNTNPVITIQKINPRTISTGTVTINFTTNKLPAKFNVTVNGNNATQLSANDTTKTYIYTYEVTSSEPQGTAQIIIEMTDLAGLTTNQIMTILIDQTGANTTAEKPTEGSYLNNNKPEISLKLEDEQGINQSTITFTLDTTTINLTNSKLSYSTITKTLKYMPTENLTEGRHNITITAEDNLGNNVQKQWHFFIDTTKPTVNITAPANGTIITDKTFLLSTTINDANSITQSYAIAGGKRYNLTAGQATITTKYVTDVIVNAVDEAGNTGTNKITIIPRVDETAPTINNTTPTGMVNTGTPTITAEIHDISQIDESSIRLTIDGTTYNTTATEMNWTAPTLTFTPTVSLADGQAVTVTLNASDTKGNNATKSWSFIIDTTNPTVNITAPANNTEQNSSLTVSYNITELNLDYVQARVDTGAWTNITSQTQHTFDSLTMGVHDLTIKATDKAGSSGQDTIRINVTQDISPPQVTFNTPYNGQRIRTNNFTINVTITDNVAVDNATLTIGSTNYNLTNVSANEYITNVSLNDGTYNLQVSANDTAGNEINETIQVEVNTGIIDGTLTGKVKDQNGNVIFNAQVNAYLNGRLMNSTTTSADGSYTMLIEYGSYTINATKTGYTQGNTTATITAGQTTTKDITLTKGDDVSIDSITFTGAKIEGQNITITADILKDNIEKENVNISLYVNDLIISTKTIEITQNKKINFTWEAIKGTQTVKVSANTLKDESDILNNNKTEQITIKGLDEVIEMELFAPPYNLGSSETFYAVVVLTNIGTETILNIPINLTAEQGITRISPEQAIVSSLQAGNATTETWQLRTGTANTTAAPNSIYATIMTIINATETVQSAPGQGFN